MSPGPFGFYRTRITGTLAVALLAGLCATVVRADDRDLLRQSVADPYLFILLDTSGSMNWSPKTATCTTGDCYVPLQADDPQSKFYQARKALYDVLTDSSFPKINLGFGTYNQDSLGVKAKHWLYEATSNGPSITGYGPFPAIGNQDVFGLNWSCTSGDDTGCAAGNPADLPDTWERSRVQRLPKGGISFTTTIADFFVRNSSGTTYKVRYAPLAGSYGANLTVTVSVWKCSNSDCSSNSAVAGSPAVVGFKQVTRSDGLPGADFLSWDNGDNRNNPQLGYFTQGTVSDSTIDANHTCDGWDPNNDTNSDKANSYDLRFPTDSSDSRGASFTVGDVIPLDWKSGKDHKTDILSRLAPNYPSSPPDFRIATYLKDSRLAGESFLHLKDDRPNALDAKRPLFANGSTPIGASMAAFRTWYNGCTGTGDCAGTGGWVATASNPNASIGDTSFRCRQKYLLILTDGDETCGGDPCAMATRLRSEGVTIFVVAFGVENSSGNKLNCMGDADHIFYPQDEDELVSDLQKAIGSISEDPRAFASAAVPSVQAEVADRIFLSSFRPIGDRDPVTDEPAAVWDGHLDAYLKPLPLKNGKPDRSRVCPAVGGSQPRTSCFLWDAGDVLVTQAPTKSALSAASSLDQTTLRLGLNTDQRRVFYPKANTGSGIPSTLRLLVPPTGNIKTDPDWSDLWTGLKVLPAFPTFPAVLTDPQYASTKTRIEDIIKNTLVIKQATLQQTGLPDQPINYVLGDIFHADPLLMDRPSDFGFYSGNLHGNKGINSDCVNDTGYRCYAKKHSHRRKMLLVGANDGQLHAFEAGVWDKTKQVFNDGTGKEMFSYIPRLGMPIVREQAEAPGKQIFGVDGTPRVDDVYIDPSHNGTPTTTDREWRTVAIGGFREGGFQDGGGRITGSATGGAFISGYYALDVTQPDQLDSNKDPINQNVVPTCLSLTNQTVSGCGTLPFPSILWEFTDLVNGSRPDEDGNLNPDLGETWSVPTIGRIRVKESSVETDKFVAIFGGGNDPDNKTSPKRGNWLYMVDIETGKAIYKRKLTGAATADPAVLDADLDGFLDTIYIGTTAGFLYKVDMSTAGTLQNTNLPSPLTASPPLVVGTQVKRITDVTWDPFPVFDTGGKPIYLPVTTFYAAHLNRFALAFGTGDREALWDPDTQEGRFYLIIDNNFKKSDVSPTGLPFHDSNYKQIPSGSGDATAGTSYVLNPGGSLQQGWYLQLPVNERVITQSFGLAGVIIFSGFAPDESSPDRPCARGGASHIFVVYADNANGVMQSGGVPIRFRTVGNFVTNPYVEQEATKNPPPTGGGSIPPIYTLDDIQKGVIESLKRFFPECAKFANYRIAVSGSRDDTAYERYATIPIGICERNWKEH